VSLDLNASSAVQVFGNITAGTDEAAPLFLLDPARESRTLRLLRVLVMMFALSVLCAAVFTEPAISQIEKVGRLVHRT
jgi:hypothetical protein